MIDAKTKAIEQLREVDMRVEAAADTPLRSLGPGRARATPLADLARALLRGSDSDEVVEAFAKGLEGLAWAQVEAFPRNLFWDLDYVASSVITRARAGPESASMVGGSFDLLAELQGLYGRESAINFSYVHDFTYGFDWAKWVAREPTQDGSVGPFDLLFLRYMKQRAGELVALIERDDHKYPKLPEGATRNPFPFSREPEAESRLFPELVRRGLIPVETWRVDAQPDSTRPFYDLRVDVARELGLET